MNKTIIKQKPQLHRANTNTHITKTSFSRSCWGVGRSLSVNIYIFPLMKFYRRNFPIVFTQRFLRTVCSFFFLQNFYNPTWTKVEGLSTSYTDKLTFSLNYSKFPFKEKLLLPVIVHASYGHFLVACWKYTKNNLISQCDETGVVINEFEKFNNFQINFPSHTHTQGQLGSAK